MAAAWHMQGAAGSAQKRCHTLFTITHTTTILEQPPHPARASHQSALNEWVQGGTRWGRAQVSPAGIQRTQLLADHCCAMCWQRTRAAPHAPRTRPNLLAQCVT
jgi:hypothetical protein